MSCFLLIIGIGFGKLRLRLILICLNIYGLFGCACLNEEESKEKVIVGLIVIKL